MVAEIVGTAIGVVGLLGQLFDGCVKAYGYFRSASHLDTDSQRLTCKVRIEEMRLVVWGREWGVAEGKLEAHLASERNPQMKMLATQILEELHNTVTDFRKLQDRYGLVDARAAKLAANSIDVDVGVKGKTGKKPSPSPSRKNSEPTDEGKSNGTKSLLNTERSWKKEFTLRTKWVIAGVSFHEECRAFA